MMLEPKWNAESSMPMALSPPEAPKGLDELGGFGAAEYIVSQLPSRDHSLKSGVPFRAPGKDGFGGCLSQAKFVGGLP